MCPSHRTVPLVVESIKCGSVVTAILVMDTSRTKFFLKDAIYQIWASFVSQSLTIHAGINLAFATILLPDLIFVEDGDTYQGNNETTILIENYTIPVSNGTEGLLRLSKNEASWIASIVTITTPLGSLLSGVLMDRFGRKPTCLLTAVVLILAWCTTAATTSHLALLYLGRALAGVGGGMSTATTVYVSEISHSSIRPLLLATISSYVSFGILLATLLGWLLPWRGVAITCALLAAASLAVLTTIPESPIWLSLHNKGEERLMHSLRWFYRNEEVCDDEFLRLQQREARPLLNASEPKIESFKGLGKTWKPLLLLTILFTIQQLTGGYVIIFYAMQIFQEAGSVAVDGWASLIVLGAIRFLMAILAVFLVVGRKILLFASGTGMAVSIMTAGLLLRFWPPSIGPVICILIFVTFSSFGYLVIPWALTSELLPHRIRGWGSGVMVSYAYFMMFLNVKFYFFILETIGLSNVFLFYAATCVVGVIFVQLFIPETMGKTFEEIEKNF